MERREHPPPTSHFQFRVTTNRNWLSLIGTAAGWEGPGQNWVLALAPVPFVCLVLAHISLKESTTLNAQMLKQLHYDLPAATFYHSIVLKVSWLCTLLVLLLHIQ